MYDRDLSFFRLAASRPDTGEPNLLHELTPDEFDAYHAEATPLVEALLAAIQAYSETRPALSLMAVYLAADIVRYSVGRDIREDEADA